MPVHDDPYRLIGADAEATALVDLATRAHAAQTAEEADDGWGWAA